MSSNSRLSQYMPILSWLPSYRREWLRPDFIAGLVVLTLLVPEGMAYAQMAGLPPETAFYTAPAAMDRFRASGLADLIGEDHLYPSVHQAVSVYLVENPEVNFEG